MEFIMGDFPLDIIAEKIPGQNTKIRALFVLVFHFPEAAKLLEEAREKFAPLTL
jgi:hypothetical protein